MMVTSITDVSLPLANLHCDRLQTVMAARQRWLMTKSGSRVDSERVEQRIISCVLGLSICPVRQTGNGRREVCLLPIDQSSRNYFPGSIDPAMLRLDRDPSGRKLAPIG